MDENGQMEQLRGHSDVLCYLCITLDRIDACDVCARRPFAQEHEYRPYPRNAWREVDVGIKILRDTGPSCKVDERVVEPLEANPQLRAKTFEVQVGSKPAANTHQLSLSSHLSASRL